MTTLLQIVQDALLEMGFSSPSTVIGNSDATVKQALKLLERAGRENRDKYRWPELNNELTITLVDSQANYAFPTAYDYQVFRTHWDSSQNWELYGPISEQEWQAIENGLTTTSPRRRFRIKGIADNEFFISPTPDSTDAGDTLVLEYQGKNWIRPVTWVTSTTFSANAYCFYNGNYYQTSAGGVTGATAPTHTSGSS